MPPLESPHLEGDAGHAIPVTVHDRDTWFGRGLYFDLLALSLALLGALALGVDLYAAGYARAFAPPGVDAHFRPLARMGLEALVLTGSFAWIAGRLLRAAYRELPGSG